MTFRLTKGKNDKPPVLTCIRTDGTQTYQPGSDFFALHDLLHYAVETTLGYRHAFLGLVAAGRNLDQFGTQNGIRDTYTDEEIWAEQIIGILQWSLVGASAPPTDTELVQRLIETCAHQGVTAPAITPAQMQQIRACAQDLHTRWHNLEPGTSLDLLF